MFEKMENKKCLFVGNGNSKFPLSRSLAGCSPKALGLGGGIPRCVEEVP